MSDFIRRERIYILMVFFILAVGLLNSGRLEERRAEGKKAFSSMTLKDLGITEEKIKAFFESDKPAAKFFKHAINFGFFIFIIALILNLRFIFLRALKLREGIKKPAGDFPIAVWGISGLIRVIVSILFFIYVIAILEGFVVKHFGVNIDFNLRMIINTFFIDIAAGLIILYFVIIKYREQLQALGLRFKHFFKDVLTGITAYLFILPFLLVVLILSIWLLDFLGYTSPPQPVFEIFMEEHRSKVLIFLTVFVSVFGPIVEEVFFRGFMYSALRKHAGVLASAFLSAAIFSSLHTNMVGFLPILALGMLLAYLYETTGSLVSSITVHIIHNSLIVSLVFFVKSVLIR